MRSLMMSLLLPLSMLGCDGTPSVVDTDVDINDLDGDGFNQAQDCDDSNPDINPDAEDMAGDGVDSDCDGVDGVDADGDGFAGIESGGDDCDDADVSINPDATDVGWNGIDEDCTGTDRHDYTVIGLGDNISCGARTTGDIDCWGSDLDGLISNKPTGQGWTAFAGGDGWMCGLQEGVIRCWGDDESGIVSNVPTIAGEGFNAAGFQQLEAGTRHACAITTLGEGVCWGDDEFGQVSGLTEFEIVSVAPGDRHTCVVLAAGGFATCFGADDREQLTPRPSVNTRFTSLAAGDNHTCGIQQQDGDQGVGILSCWGEDMNGQINPANRTGPYTDLAANANHNCGILSGTDIECWGQGNFGQLGAPDRTAVQVEMGGTHGCARNAVGIVFCWGDDSSGQATVP